MYQYNARVLRVIDGDTVDLDVDVGFDIHFNLRVRLAGINTPELNSRLIEERDKAQKAKQYVSEYLTQNNGSVTINTEKDRKDKYGRYLVWIKLPWDTITLNDRLVQEGLATVYQG